MGFGNNLNLFSKENLWHRCCFFDLNWSNITLCGERGIHMKKPILFPISTLVLGILLGCGSGGNGNSDEGLVNIDSSSSSTFVPEPTIVTGKNFGEIALITEFLIPADENGNTTSPFGLALDDRGNLWFSGDITSQNFSPDMIGVFDTRNKIFPKCETVQDVCRRIINTAPNSDENQQQPPDPFDAKPRGLIFDPLNRDFWFAEFGTSSIGKIEGQSNFRNLFEFPAPTKVSGVLKITLSSGKIWFTEQSEDRVGSLDPLDARAGTSNGFTEFSVCDGPTGIDSDGKGNIWFTCLFSNEIGMLEAANGFNPVFFSIPTPDNQPTGLVVDPQGVIWFTEKGRGQIGRFDPNGGVGGQFSEFPLTFGSQPAGITIDSVNNTIWFTEFAGNRIGKLEIGSVIPGSNTGIEEFPIPTLNSAPTSLLVDSDGTVWFSETTAQKIGKLTPP